MSGGVADTHQGEVEADREAAFPPLMVPYDAGQVIEMNNLAIGLVDFGAIADMNALAIGMARPMDSSM
jgi:hypothetical protein